MIETALNEAVKNKDYFAHFQKDLLIEMARVLGDVAVQQAEMLALLRKLEARDSNTQQAIIEGVDPALIITVAQKFSPGSPTRIRRSRRWSAPPRTLRA